MDIAGRIKRARESCGISQETLAAMLGVDKNTVWRWEKGRSDPRATDMEKIAVALDMPIEKFYSDSMPADSEFTSKKQEDGTDGQIPGNSDFSETQTHASRGIIIKYSKGNEKVELIIPPGTPIEEINATISGTVRAISGEVPLDDTPE